jgi:hypothetical protein
MKTTLLYYMGLTLMCLTLTAITFAAPMTAPVRSLDIPAQNGAMVADGVAEDGYSASQSTTAFNIVGSTGDDADFTASFQVCYTAYKLWLLATMLDDYACEIPYTTSTDPWTWDNIEVFLSLDTTSTTTAYDSNTIQLRFNRGIQDSAQTPGRAAQEDYEVYYENTADGWVIEVGIPWTAVLQTGAVPEDIMAFISPVVNGFDFSGADNDTDGADARDCQVAWDDDDPGMPDATEDLAWNNRTMFGIMRLISSYDPGDPIAVYGLKTSGILLTPNPATNFIRFDKLEGQNSVVIFSISGTRVLRLENIVRDQAIDISQLPSGIYTILLNNEETLRFVKE